MEDLQDKIIELMDLFDGEVTTADKIDIPKPREDVQTIEAINNFMKRNPMAGGGMLVQPSADGSRPGYMGQKEKSEILKTKARNYLKNLPKNSNIVILNVAKELEMGRGIIDQVLKEKQFQNKKFNLLKKANTLTSKQFAEEYKKFQKSDFFKKGFDKEFAEYLNDAGFKPVRVKKGVEGKWSAETVSNKIRDLNIKTVSPKVNVLTDKEILKEAKQFNINTKGLSPDELRIKVKTARRDENARIREQEDPEYKEQRKQKQKIISQKYYKKQLSTKEGRAKLLEQRKKAKRNQFKKLGLDPLATNADEAIWRDSVMIATKNVDGKGRFSIESGYSKTMDAKDYYSNKIKIKDNQTGKIFNYNNFKNYVNKNANSFGLKNYDEAIKSYRQKFFINDKPGLRKNINLALIPDYNIDPKKYDPRSAYTIQHDFGRQNNPLKTSLAFYNDNLDEYQIRTDFEKAWAASKKSKTPLADRKKAFNVFKKDLANLNIQSVPSMVTRERFFGKGLDLTDILKTAKKEGATLPRGVLKEAAELDKLLLNLAATVTNKCSIGNADGGRIGYSLGSEACLKIGKEALDDGLLKGFKNKQQVNLAETILRAGGGLKSAFALRNIFGPAAIAASVAFEGGLIGYDMLTSGKTLREAFGDNLLNYALGKDYQINPQEEMFKRFKGLGYDDQQIGSIKRSLDAMNTINTGAQLVMDVGQQQEALQKSRGQPETFMGLEDQFIADTAGQRAEQNLKDAKNQLAEFNRDIVRSGQADVLSNYISSGDYAKGFDLFEKAQKEADIQKLESAGPKFMGSVSPKFEEGRQSDLNTLRSIENPYPRLLRDSGYLGLAGGGRAGYKLGKGVKIKPSKVRSDAKSIIDENAKLIKQMKETGEIDEISSDLNQVIKKALDEDLLDKKDRIIDSINISGAKKRKNYPYNQQVFEEPKNLDFYDSIIQSNFRTKTGPYFDRIRRARENKAGGGLLKQAGDRSGPPPESGPNPQGLQGLLNRVKKV